MDIEPRIYAIEIGRRTAELQNFLYQNEQFNPSNKIEIGYYFWCIKYPKRAILIDSGFEPQIAEKRGLKKIKYQIDRLKCIGVKVSDVTTIILTHLHWDHAGGTKFFPNAKILVPNKDLIFYNSYATSYSIINRYIEKNNIEFLNLAKKEGRVELIDGDYILNDNIKIHWVGGHTPGTHIVSIQTNKGLYVFASDLGSLYLNIRKEIVPGIFQNLLDCLNGLRKIRNLAKDEKLIIPSHDLEISKNFMVEDEGIILLS